MNGRSWLGLLAALVLTGLLWWSQGDGPSPAPDRTEPSASASEQSRPQEGGTEPSSGLPTVALADLPSEATDTVRLIDAGGPYPYPEDDGVFGNFEQLLPERDRGYYREYTVETPGLDHRGARRIVAGSQGELYWTEDHYSSFERITR